MRERPILFSGPMIRAILEGRKVQTRRLYKPRDGSPYEIMGELPDGKPWPHWFDPNKGPEFHPLACPYGQPGDRLWVKETHALVPRTAYWHDASIPHRELEDEWCIYREGWERSAPSRWRPSIHMPRWASRITLEVTNVRVERLHDISEEDARAEGVARAADGYWYNYAPDGPTHRTARESFCSLWESINGAESWDANPWVWVVEFSKLEVTK